MALALTWPWRGVLLDIDGTIVDSNDAHAQAWARALAEGGYDIDINAIRPLIGMGGDKLLVALTGVPPNGAPTLRLKEAHAEIFRTAWLPRLNPQPGSRELVQALRKRGITIAVCTGSSASEAAELLKIASVHDLVELVITSDDVLRSKPDPDIIHAGMDRLGLLPHETVVIGDTPYDIVAGRRAGVAAIAVTCGGCSAEQLKGAIVIARDPESLVRELAQDHATASS